MQDLDDRISALASSVTAPLPFITMVLAGLAGKILGGFRRLESAKAV